MIKFIEQLRNDQVLMSSDRGKVVIKIIETHSIVMGGKASSQSSSWNDCLISGGNVRPGQVNIREATAPRLS